VEIRTGTAKSGDLDIYYEDMGDQNHPPVLLIMGLGAQLIGWPDGFCDELVARGLYLIRFDNRDAGQSTHLTNAPMPDFMAAMAGDVSSVAYTLSDMAADTVGLLDALGLASAHVVGVSMGGMIAQMLAAQHGRRVRALVSIMSSSGSRRLPQPDWRLRLALLRRPNARGDRAKAIAATFAIYKRISSPGYPPDDTALRDQVARDVDRSYYPPGLRRQLLAIMASGSRTSMLGRITAPTLILHGADDPLVPVAAAHDLQRRIPGAELEVFPGMGHDLPRALVPAFTTRIAAHLRRADAQPGSAVS